MHKHFLQKLFTGFLILLLSVRLFVPSIIFAQEVTPTDTPAPTPTSTQVDQTQVNNSATDTNTTTSTANTGDNGVNVTPTPTIDLTATDTPTPTTDPTAIPTYSPTPTDDPSISTDPSATQSSTVDASNSADVNNTVGSTGNTGSNNVSTNSSTNTASDTASPTPSPTPSQINVQTGDAVSIVAGDNTINTTSVNSDFTTQTINVFGDQTGNIDLSTLFQLVSSIITNDQNSNPVINIQITGVNNYAYLSNTVVSTANTGGNSVNSDPGTQVTVQTGNADSIVSLINKVNLTVVNSSLHLVSINIFGHLTGNIILPNLTPLQSTSCSSCGVSFNTQNQAVVNNTVDATVNTGQNTLVASNGATLTTGNAQSDVNTVNVINQTVLGMIFENLFINEFGTWNGSFLGWDNFAPQTGGSLMLSSSTPSGGLNPTNTINNTTVNNTAYINNVISSLANTGKNTANGQNVLVNTGSAYSAVSLINFVNSNFLNSLGFFGFINIFGMWDGNIGGADKFITPTPTPDQNTASNSDQSSQQEDGGALTLTSSNNTGPYVLPGDTVTLFANVKNTGTGKVYGATMHISLIADGTETPIKDFSLGDIAAGHGDKLTTGLVLSKNAKGGDYTIHVTVTGSTGPNNTVVTAVSDNSFTIYTSVVQQNSTPNGVTSQAQTLPEKAILGATTDHNTNSDAALYYLLLGILTAYLLVRIVRAREQLVLLFAPGASFKSRLNLLRLFLL